MKVNRKANNKKKVEEKIILLSIIGSLEAIKEGTATIDEIEKFIFSPHMYKIMKEKNYNEKILCFVEKGCELEDIYSIIPEKMAEVVDHMKREALLLLKNYDEYNSFFWLEE
ncbi:MAG: DUF3969 family protein [Acetatifactor sp.]